MVEAHVVNRLTSCDLSSLSFGRFYRSFKEFLTQKFMQNKQTDEPDRLQSVTGSALVWDVLELLHLWKRFKQGSPSSQTPAPTITKR